MKNEKINVILNSENGTLSLPEAIADCIDRARKFDIKVLLFLAKHGDDIKDVTFSSLADELACDVADIKASLAFWNGTGILISSEEEETKPSKKKKEEKTGPKKRIKAHEIPQYSTQELNKLLEKHLGIGLFLDECQNILGKIFNTSDVATVMGIMDYLGVEEDYILVLMHHCAEKEVKSMRYLEKTAIACVDEGITKAGVLEATLKEREATKEIQSKIKGLFGLNSRAFTAKEKTLVGDWINTYNFDIDVITRAYEITVDTINKPSIPYAGKILEKWYTEGLKTLPEIEEYLGAYKKSKGEGSSFDLDDFFNAAVSRSYQDKK